MIFNSPVYPIPPSFEDQLLETESTLRYLDFLKNQGVKTIMTTAGTSQYNLMSLPEVRRFNASVFNFQGNKIIGIPAMSSHQLLEEIRWYNSFKLDECFLLILFPERYYSNDQIIDFFKTSCSVSDYPILVHGNTIKRGNGGDFIYDYSIIEQLARIDGFIGMKEESPSLDFAIKNLPKDLGLEIIVAGGSMRRYWTLEPFGATTYLAGVGSFNPKMEEDFYRNYKLGNMEEAKIIMTEIEKPLFDVFMSIGWHASMRYSLKKMGYIKDNRDPFYKLNEKEESLLNKSIEKIL